MYHLIADGIKLQGQEDTDNSSSVQKLGLGRDDYIKTIKPHDLVHQAVMVDGEVFSVQSCMISFYCALLSFSNKVCCESRMKATCFDFI